MAVLSQLILLETKKLRSRMKMTPLSTLVMETMTLMKTFHLRVTVGVSHHQKLTAFKI